MKLGSLPSSSSSLLQRAEAAMSERRFPDAGWRPQTQWASSNDRSPRSCLYRQHQFAQPVLMIWRWMKYLHGLRNVSVAAVMEFDLRDLMRFRMTAPRVQRGDRPYSTGRFSTSRNRRMQRLPFRRRLPLRSKHGSSECASAVRRPR